MTRQLQNINVGAFVYPLLIAVSCILSQPIDCTAGDISLSIETTTNSIQGRHDTVDVYISDGFRETGAFDIIMAYDASALNFYKAIPGPKLYGADYYHWEYFTYRFSQFGYCGAICPSGKLRVTGLAEVNNGPYHPAGFGVIKGDVLFSLDFLVSTDRTLECAFLPIRFCWFDCGDNTLISKGGDTLFISHNVYDSGGQEISNPEDVLGYPTYGGAQNVDCNQGGTRRIFQRDIDFYNGGVHVACAEQAEPVGDMNHNYIPFEIADAVLFSRYFVYGPTVFVGNYSASKSASDVNRDGVPLTLADMVYMIRVIVGDALPEPPGDTVLVDYEVENGLLTLKDSIGAAHFRVGGKVVPQNHSALNMEFAYDLNEDITRILVYDMNAGPDVAGEFIRIPGEILYMEMATYAGRPVIANRIIVPVDFFLSQNYPNPFNSSTIISFALPVRSDYELTIHNVTGQIVTTFEGTAEAGRVDISWDAADYASGVYFYQLRVGETVETKRMVLVK